MGGLLFDSDFWGSNHSFNYFALVKEHKPSLAKAESFTYFLNVHPAVHRPILMTFAFGKSSYKAEKMSEEHLKSAVLRNLQEMFGKTVGKLPKLRSIWRSGWASNKDVGGGYSFADVGSKPADWGNLAAPCMRGLLHFAGSTR